MKILIAVDEGQHTTRMLTWLAQHKEWFGAAHEYTVVHCVPSVPTGAANMLGKDDLRLYYEQEAEKALAPARHFFEQEGLKATFVYKTGHAGEKVSQMADKEGFELVVLGSHGHSALGKLILGSVASKVMSLCSTPVLLVR